MQISKFWAVACSAILCVSQTRSGAVDNEAQKKAREALENQLGAQPEQAAPAPVAPAPARTKPQKSRREKPAPAPRVETQPATTPSADTVPLTRPLSVPSQPIPPAPRPSLRPVPQRDLSTEPTQRLESSQPVRVQPAAPARVDSDKIAKAREAMREKMNEVQTQNPEPTPRPVVVAKPDPDQTETAVKHAPSSPKKPKKKVEPATNFEPLPDNAKVNDNSVPSVAASQTGPSANQNTTTAQPPLRTKREQKSKVSSTSASRYQQLEGPPSSFSAAKQQKLDELLRRYRADEVTPEQYHTERAKIVSEP